MYKVLLVVCTANDVFLYCLANSSVKIFGRTEYVKQDKTSVLPSVRLRGMLHLP